MLNAEIVAKALNIPLTPPNPVEFQPITQVKVVEMVQVVSQRQSSNTHVVLRREIYLELWFLDHILCSNVYPCQHSMQKWEDILMTLFWIVNRQWWTSAKLFMVALIYFEDKVHLKKFQRGKKYSLFFP